MGGSVLPRFFSPIVPDVPIIWKGAHPNNYGGTIDPKVIVIHTMGGSLIGTDAWFNNPAAVVSAHYGVGYNGAIHQYVKTNNRAYANGILEPGNRWPYPQNINPNFYTIAIETEGDADPVTSDMFASTKFLVNKLAKEFHIELITSHHIISPHSRQNCAGSRWTSSYIHQLSPSIKVLI